MQDQASVVSFLADVIEGFLVKHGFKNRSAHGLDSGQPRIAKRKRFESVQSRTDERPSRKTARHPLTESTNGLVIGDGTTAELTWVDPKTQKAYVIDPRTGNSYAREDGPVDSQAEDKRPMTRRILNQRNTSKPTKTPEWIRKALCDNEVFSLAESGVRCVPSPAPIQRIDLEDENRSARMPWTKRFNKAFSAVSVSNDMSSSSFDKRSLEEAHVLGQVDSKFIACLLEVVDGESEGSSNCDSRALVLIDQHAADERIRVERFLKALCIGYQDRDVGGGVQKRILQTPVPVLLTKFERDRLMENETMRKAFEGWGLDVDVCALSDETTDNDEGYGSVYFTSVPEVVADKVSGSFELCQAFLTLAIALSKIRLRPSGTRQRLPC